MVTANVKGHNDLPNSNITIIPITSYVKKYGKCSNGICNKNFLTIFVEKLFYKQGILVSRYPFWFIVIPLITTIAFTCGMLKFSIKNNLNEMLTPWTAYSNHESKMLMQFFEGDGGLFHFLFGVSAKDDGSILRENYPDEILSLFNYVTYNYTIKDGGKNYSFHDLQIDTHPDFNYLALTILKVYRSHSAYNFTYPVISFNKEFYFIGNLLRKVTVDEATKFITDAKIVWFSFTSSVKNELHAKILDRWAMSFLQAPSLNMDPKLRYYFWNNDLASSEMTRNCWSLAPFTVLAFSVVVIFSFIVACTKNPVTSKPWEALASIFSVVLACGSGFGIVFYMGFPFSSMTAVLPILVLALGMDVTFITLRNWQSTSPLLPANERLAETMKESGPSIVITALTNILSAAIGCYTNTMVIYIFCMTLSISLITLFLLQITFFAGFLTYAGRREELNKHGCMICLTVKKDKNTSPVKVETSHGSHSPSDWWCKCSKFMAKIICTNYCRATVTVLTLLYWATSTYFCTQTKLGLTVDKLFPDDSPLLTTFRLDQVDIQTSGITLLIVVSQPPNFSQPADYNLFTKMVKEFENYTYCIGSNATALWLRPYETFLQFVDDDDEDGIDSDHLKYLDTFLQSEGRRWQNYIRTESKNNGSSLTIKKFVFNVVYQRSYDWNLRQQYTTTTRDIASRYPQFEVTSWFEDNANFVADQLASLPGNLVQDLLVTAACMSVVCVLFIPNLFNTVCAIVTVFSINIGTFGYLTVWDVSLDPISISCLMLSIGYSVDFTSHICYHYYASDGTTEQEKLTAALSSIGLPMIESGLSTLMCVACLCFVPSYIEMVFFKTIFLVILFGLLHGLLILPTYLAWIPLNCIQRCVA